LGQPAKTDDSFTWRFSMLIIHGDDDRNVAFQQTTDLVEKLHAQNIRGRLVSIRG
jgi:dipeptidyl aminopeptidase/acylaminoacyl peptidase